MREATLCDILFDEISKMPVIDTHEHLAWQEDRWYNDGNDLLCEYLTHYMKSDVISAGLTQEDFVKLMDQSRSISERWRIVEPFWEASRYTGYGRALDIAARGIYGVKRISSETVEELDRLFRANKKPGHFRRVLKELCGIEVSMLDVAGDRAEGKSDFFRPVWQPQRYIMPSGRDGRDLLKLSERDHAIRVKNLDDWMAALEAEMDYIFNLHGVKTLKSAIAYARTLHFEQIPYSRARAMFADVLDKWICGETEAGFPHELQDFMMHYTLKLAGERNMTFQFHTGILEGNGNILKNSDPSLLNNLFLAYPDVDFDLFHMGYPYQGVSCALCKMFPNVFIDMCWSHIISPSACVGALDDFLDAVPYNKISAFGGDYLFVDGVYGHLYLSRLNVSRVLAGKIARGVVSENKALDIAKAMYYENPKRIFKL